MKKLAKSLVLLFLASVILPLNFAFANEGEFIILNGAEPESIDFATISGVPEHRIYLSLGEGLVTTDPVTARPVPGLAKSWDISNDGKTYTFHLRKTTWSDGVPITAQTIVDSWLRILNPKTAAPYAWFPSMFLKGAGDYNGGKAGPETVQIRALDDYTFQMDLIGPLPYVTGALSHYAFSLAPLHAIKKYGKAWTNPENYVSNGPFIIEKWEPQKQLTVVPSPTYWDKENVKLERVVYIASDDDNTRYNMLINSEADWMASGIPLDQLEDAELRDDYKNNPYLGTYYYNIQNEVKPFNDVRVRRALSMSISRKHIVEQITKAGQTVAYSMVPSMAGYSPSDGEHENIDKARQYLADAGFPGGKGFPEFEILYNTSEAHKKIAEFIQQQWAENLGLKVTLKNQEWKTYLSSSRAGDFTISRAGWIGDYNDPNTFLDMFVTGAGMNSGNYSNPAYDALINSAATMEAGANRMAVLKQAENIFLTQDQHLIPIYGYVSLNLIDTNKWGGWYNNVMDTHPTKTIFLK